jgi:hypothetical protein
MSEYSFDRPMLNTTTCEHGNKMKDIAGVYEGDSFSDPGCQYANGKQRSHTATQDKYPIDPTWYEDQDLDALRRERLRLARAARKEAK